MSAVAPVAERRLTVSTAPGDNERVFTLLVLGLDVDTDAAIRRPNVVAGDPLTATDTDGVLAPQAWADRYGLGVGDELLLAGRRWQGWRGKTALRFTLAGFATLALAYVGSRFVLEVVLHRGLA